MAVAAHLPVKNVWVEDSVPHRCQAVSMRPTQHLAWAESSAIGLPSGQHSAQGSDVGVTGPWALAAAMTHGLAAAAPHSRCFHHCSAAECAATGRAAPPPPSAFESARSAPTRVATAGARCRTSASEATPACPRAGRGAPGAARQRLPLQSSAGPGSHNCRETVATAAPRRASDGRWQHPRHRPGLPLLRRQASPGAIRATRQCTSSRHQSRCHMRGCCGWPGPQS